MIHLNRSRAEVHRHELSRTAMPTDDDCLWKGWKDDLLSQDPTTRISEAKRHNAFGTAAEFPSKVAVFYSCYKAPEKLMKVTQDALATDIAKLLGTKILAGTGLGENMNQQNKEDWLSKRDARCSQEDWAEVSQALAYHAVDMKVELIIFVAVHQGDPHKKSECPLATSVWCQYELQALDPDTRILPIFTPEMFHTVVGKIHTIKNSPRHPFGQPLVHQLLNEKDLQTIPAKDFHTLPPTAHCKKHN